ncbi:flagellin lysine-N-methylase [Anaerovibrio sp.]|uniref:flagellin lysine-N-methylase n=1 Tax=Anaerovibrio sp. TaxID=1872532 RepID=UPI003F16EC10
MITIMPDFYSQFSCKAGACQHTCCQGWEIDIDDAAASRYLQMTGTLGDRMRQCITRQDGIYSFRLTPEERCPFLQHDGLCQIILHAGEESLCNVCAMHPRFFTYLGELELAGIGMCCEKTCELLLGSNAPLCFYIDGTDIALNFSELMSQPDIAVWLPEDCNIHVAGSFCGIAQMTIQQIISILGKTAPIDDSWCQLLDKIRHSITAGEISLALPAGLPPDSQAIYDRICQYILYRQLERLPHWHFTQLTAYAQLNTSFIYLAAQITSDLPEALRLWSAQIEYDTDNVEIILENLSQ